jgi:hypothetical protein
MNRVASCGMSSDKCDKRSPSSGRVTACKVTSLRSLQPSLPKPVSQRLFTAANSCASQKRFLGAIAGNCRGRHTGSQSIEMDFAIRSKTRLALVVLLPSEKVRIRISKARLRR